jgi:hypothetical protein
MNHRLLVYNAPYEKENLVRIFEPPNPPLIYPQGLQTCGGGVILAADPAANDIFEISIDGSIKSLFSNSCSDVNSVCLPSSLCLDAIDPQKYFWMVDRGNHRLLKLDFSYHIIKQVGACGIAKGCLFYPATLAMFHDAVLVVAEGPRNPNLVFLTTEGIELSRFYLDYVAVGVLVQNNILYVCQNDGNTVHRYARQ